MPQNHTHISAKLRRSLPLVAGALALLCPASAFAYGPSDPAVPYVQTLPFMRGGAFTRDMTAPGIQADVSSPTLVGDLVNLVKSQGAFVGDGYAGGDPICQTTSSTSLVSMVGQYSQTAQTLALQQGMPIPPGCLPDNARDATMSVYNPTTHELWTTWRTSTPVQNGIGCTDILPWGQSCYGDGRWHFFGGGIVRDVRMSPGYFDYGSLPGYSTTNWGTSATSTVNAARTILASEVIRGYIPHAIAVASSTALNCQGFDRWPAQRNDGNDSAAPPTCIPEGTFFRIPASVNLSSLGLPKFTLMVAEAAQHYGMCVCESTGGGPTLQVENTTQYGYDAWTPQNLLFGLQRFTAMRAFPWGDLQAVAAPTRSAGTIAADSSLSVAPASVAAGSPLSLDVYVASLDGRPAPGAAYLSDSSGNEMAATMLSTVGGVSRGTLTLTLPGPGTYTYTVSYGGDQTVKPSVATVTVTVTDAGATTTGAGTVPSFGTAPSAGFATDRRAAVKLRRHRHRHSRHKRRGARVGHRRHQI